jgi:hypothetical protein
MFQSKARLTEDIETLLGAMRELAGARYVCLMEPGKILFETPEPEGNEVMTLRRLLELQGAAIFALPAAMAGEGEGPSEDPFEGWEHDEILLAFVNGKVGIAIACASAEAAREPIMKPLKILVDRLFRYNESWRLTEKGRGLFFGRPKLDFVTIAHHQ